jgi:hypothetical protein
MPADIAVADDTSFSKDACNKGLCTESFRSSYKWPRTE